MKTIIVAIALMFVATTAAEARKRTRVTVYPTQRPIVAHPFAVDFLLRNILCAFHVFSVGPQGKPGSCADHMITRPGQHRVV